MARPAPQLFCLAYLAWGFLLQGCASHAIQPAPPATALILPPPGNIATALPQPQSLSGASVGGEIVIRAVALLGAPYRYGGSGPTAFDCSGLVSYVHQGIGIQVPRTAAEQYQAATPVNKADLAPGDLLFFRTRGRGVSHVAIYAGAGRFVHAPQTGRAIEMRALEDDYYGPRFVGAGRLF
jgi:cell wall-associated NlpC family hydrolase